MASTTETWVSSPGRLKTNVEHDKHYSSLVFSQEGSSIRAWYLFGSATTLPEPANPPKPAYDTSFFQAGPRRLRPIDADDAVCKVYETPSSGGESLRESILRILVDQPWSFFGVFRITSPHSDRPTLLVAFRSAGPSTRTYHRLAAEILQEMDKRDCHNETDILLMHGDVAYATEDPRTVLPLGFKVQDVSTTLQPAPPLGSSLGAGTSSGSLGCFLSVSIPDKPAELLALTGHQCVTDDPSPIPPPPSGQPSGPVVEAPSERDRDLWAASVEALAEISTAAGDSSTTEDLSKLLQLISTYTTPLGSVICSSGLSAKSTTQERYLNWAAILVDRTRALNGTFSNGLESAASKELLLTSWVRVVAKRKDHLYKFGRTTGLTMGLPSPVDVDIRHAATSDRAGFCTKDKAVLALDQPFAAPGDAGAMISCIDKAGTSTAIGLLFGGASNPAAPRDPLGRDNMLDLALPNVETAALGALNVQLSDLVFYTELDIVIRDIEETMAQVYGPDVKVVCL